MLIETAIFSLLIQFITGIIDVYGLTLNVKPEYQKIKDILKIELGVQTIEFIFYLWLVFNITKIKDITVYRYYDWFLTTPVMLITLMIYYDEKSKTIQEFMRNNENNIFLIVILNFQMLFFGFIGEMNLINYNLAGILGFIPFCIMFFSIYKNYVEDKENKQVFYYFLIFWTLYGFAYFQNYNLKNSIYNILDLFAKNGFGLFLVWLLYTNRIDN